MTIRHVAGVSRRILARPERHGSQLGETVCSLRTRRAAIHKVIVFVAQFGYGFSNVLCRVQHDGFDFLPGWRMVEQRELADPIAAGCNYVFRGGVRIESHDDEVVLISARRFAEMLEATFLLENCEEEWNRHVDGRGCDLLCDCAVRGDRIRGERKLRKIAIIEHVGNALDELLVGYTGDVD